MFSNSFSRRSVRNFRLQDLNPEKQYRVKRLFAADSEECIQSGAELMRHGVKTVLPENQHIRHIAGLYQVTEL